MNAGELAIKDCMWMALGIMCMSS